MERRKKIVPLRFDTWKRFLQIQGEYFEIYPIYLHKKIEKSRQKSIRKRIEDKLCPMCNNDLTSTAEALNDVASDTGMMYEICTACGFWRFNVCDMTGTYDHTLPYIKHFEYESEIPSILYLSNEIRKDKSKIYSMDPVTFEKYVGSVLSDFLDCEVYHVGCNADDGIDLIALVSDDPLLIQVKRREDPNKAEGIDVVKLLFASAFARNANSGMVITSAKRFTKPAKEWIQSPRLKDIGFKLELVDINNIMAMVDAVLPKGSPAPWELHLHKDNDTSDKYFLDHIDWQIVELIDGDVLLGNTDNACKIIAFEDADLTKCYFAQIPRLYSEVESQCNLHFSDFLSILSEKSHIQIHHDDRISENLIEVPYHFLKVLSERWRSKFPDELYSFID